MSGGIKYRLTPRERTLFAEQLSLFEALRDRLKPNGIDTKLDDAELEVSVEEGPKGPEFTLQIPFDTDPIPQNGRFYVQDVFQLSQGADRILSFERSLRQDLNVNKRIGYWVSVARKDHPDAKITSHSEHLRRFLEDLDKLPKPAAGDPPLQRFLGGVLSRLHRPFPDDNEALVRKNFAVFQPVLEKTVPFGVRMKFGDPQSGLVLRREGDKIFLSVQIVMDDDSKPGLEAEKNGRMFLIDTYEIDAAGGQILGTRRELVPSEARSEDFDQAYAAVKDSPPPAKDSPELKALVAGWLKNLVPSPAPAPARPGPAIAPVVPEAPQDPAGKILHALYRFTERDGEAGKRFFEALTRQSPGMPLIGVLAVPELDRAALRDALAVALIGDAAKAEATIAAWLGEDGLQPATRTLLQALSQYSRGEWEAARRSLNPLLPVSPFARQVLRAVELRIGQGPRGQAVEILKIAAAERIEQANRHDQAWLTAVSDGIGGKAARNPEERRLAVLSFFKNFEATLQGHSGGLVSALEETPAQGFYEKELRSLLLNDPALRRLLALLEEPDAGLRESGLLTLARGSLLGQAKLPATAKHIAESLPPQLDGAQDLMNWFSGRADLGQKVEHLLPAFAEEVLAPRTLVSMAAAGVLGQVAKAAFFARAGYQTRRLRWAAEAVSVGVEAPIFVLSEKLIVSALESPEGQWAKLPRDTVGALLAFGTLRGAGLASRRFNRYLADSKGLEAWAEGRSRIALAERWQPAVADFAKAEGRAAWLRRISGKTAVPALEYLGKTGIPRAWTKRALPHAGAHALGLGGLMAANSLTRLLGLRDASQQGYAGDLVDDFLMYGHFLVAGHIAGRLGRGDIDARLAFLEAQPLQTPAAKAKSPAKSSEKSEARDSDPATPPPESKPGETPPKVDVPPEVKEFGRNLLRWLRKDLPQAGRLARDWVRALRGRPAQDGKLPAPAAPESVKSPSAEPPAPAPESLAAAPEIKSDSRPPSPPAIPEGTAAPVSPVSRRALLEPTPEAVNFRRVETEEPPRGKGEEYKVVVEVLGREEELRFQGKETRKQLVFESVLGREDLQNPPQEVGVDFGFPSTEAAVAPQHAKIRAEIHYDTKVEGRGKAREARASAKEWKFFLEDLASPGGTFVNGERISKATPLKDQDRIRLGENGVELRFHIDRAEPKAFLTRPGIPLAEGRGEWILGREHAGAGAPDIRFPISDRDLSRRHARIVRDEDGRYFVQDLSWNGTRVNLRRIHGSHELRDGDSLRLGGLTELLFTLPGEGKAAEPASPKAPPPHPNAAIPPPEQAKVHPAYRSLSPEELEAHFAKLGTEEADFSAYRAGQLALPDGRHVLLSSLNTAWALGHAGEAPANVQSLQFSLPAGATQNPALIYLDGAGRFILRGMRPESSLAIQTRPERFLPAEGEPKKPSARKQPVSGWTVLEGGERVFLGEEFYFDFWPGAPKSPYERPNPVSGEFGSVEVKENPFAIPEARTPPEKSSTLVFLDGKLQMPLSKAVRLSSRGGISEMLIRDEPGKPEVEILIPESVAKMQETRFFQEEGGWKIRSEGGEGVPLVVNGMRLPERITLDLLPDTTLEIGDLKIQIRLP
ncbi:MAG: FHA domain-containing protein [Deltaproteobacteria bacterium]|nr:FHA domain-containing protein [Deltaproteobacteria bacterium]